LRVVGCFQSAGLAKGIMTSSCEWQNADREGMWRTDSYILSFLSFVRDVGREQPPRRSPKNIRATERTLVWERARSRAFLWVYKPVGDFYLASVGRL
jgi:hypothetical protein